MEPNEIWRDVVGYETRYEVSTLGQVRSLAGRHGPYKAPRVLKPGLMNGYPYVNLCRSGSQKTYLVHRLIAKAFCEGYAPGLQVNHKNGIRHDNRAQNLEWVSTAENQRHSWRELGRKGSATGKTGANHNRSKPVIAASSDGIEIRFGSQEEAARMLGMNRSSISACLTDRARQVKGYFFYRPENGGPNE